MNALSPEALRHCLDTAGTITFSTVNPNGTVHSVPVWYRYDGEAFWVITGTDQWKTRNLRRDPRVSLMLLAGWQPTDRDRPRLRARHYPRAAGHRAA